MIYFLVNNNYQYFEARELAIELKNEGKKCALIIFPHTFTLNPDKEIFLIIKILDPCYKHFLPSSYFKYIILRGLLKKLIQPNKDDILLLFTEYELLNQILAIHFKKYGAKNYLLEDGGVGTYIPLTLKNSQPYTIKERLFMVMVRCIPSLNSTIFVKFDGLIFPMLADRFLDGVFVYRDIKITRRINVIRIHRPRRELLNTIQERVVFLNQPLYCKKMEIQTLDAYIDGLNKILTALSRGFEEVFFKFHPRELEVDKIYIVSKVLKKFPNIKILDASCPFESILPNIRPRVIASYNSTPLFNLVGSGVQPLFVYPLLPDICRQLSFKVLDELLASWGCNLPKSWLDLSSKFSAGSDFNQIQSGLTITEALIQSTER